MPTVHLKPKHVQPLWAGHPWVFAQAVARVSGAPQAGDVVEVRDPEGKFLGRGFYSPKSAIPVRIVTRDPDAQVDKALLRSHVEEAHAWRKDLLKLPNDETNGYRLINADGDQLPGVIVDMFDRVAVVQLRTIGAKRREDTIFAAIESVTGARSIVETASDVQRLEGFATKHRVARGEDVDDLVFRERGFDLRVPSSIRQKTGYYFDQRDNRAVVESLAKGRRVLDAFCFVGSFGLAAARGGASEVLGIDSSAPAIAAASANAHRNGLADTITFTRDDLKRALPELAKRDDLFDMVIVDPPKLAPTSRHVKSAERAYRRLNGNAMRVLKRGGILVTCSCSGGLKPTQFMRVLAIAARDTKRQLTLLKTGAQAPDHAVPSAFPEGRYLKCAILRVT